MSLQLVTSGSAELGVQSQYLDGERHFVDDALAGRLLLAPKFEITWSVVKSVSIFMMDVFKWVQSATKHFSHDQAMFERFGTAANVNADVPGRMDMPFRIYWAPFTSFISTCFGTKPRAHVEAAVPSSVCVVNPSALRRFATQLTLKSRWVVPVHLSHWTQCGSLVKENS